MTRNEGKDVIKSLKLQIQLNHEHVLKFHGLFTEQWMEDGDGINMFFELADCGNLHQFLKEDKTKHIIRIPNAISFLKQLLEGLKYIQQSKIVHRNFSGNFAFFLFTVGLLNRSAPGSPIHLLQGSSSAVVRDPPDFPSRERAAGKEKNLRS